MLGLGAVMKPYLLATVSSLALASVAAAADLPRKTPAMPAAVAAPQNWTGFYIGLNGGAVWHRAEFDGFDAASATSTASLTATGGTFGGQIGYNWQSRNFVYGLEADGNWVDAGGTTLTANTYGGSSQYYSKLKWLAAVRGRIGITVSPPTLVYVTGGYAAGGVDNNTAEFGGFVKNSTKSGWTAGGGIERMFARNWTVKAEALYVDLGDSSTTLNQFGSGYGATFTNTAVVARIGANFKF
jgi:outer membrane immunogenic protein